MSVCATIDEMKQCKHCKQTKPLDNFGRHTKSADRLRYNCRSCESHIVRAYRIANEARINENRRERYNALKDKNRLSVCEYRKRNRDKVVLSTFQSGLKGRYNLTLEQYSAMMKAQGCACAICKAPLRHINKLLIDHDHFTGAVRGLLCQECNVFLGLALDRVEILQAAIEYLKKARVALSQI